MRYLLIAVAFMCFVSLYSTTLYDIQFTTEPGADNTYPSPYLNEVVKVQGVVVATSFQSTASGPKFFIVEGNGGAWRGLYINDWTHPVQLGDLVSVTGTVAEHYGMTQLKQCTSVSVLSSNHPIPSPAIITTGQLASDEAYESCWVKVQNVTCSSGCNALNKWSVDDGSGACQVDDGFFTASNPFPYSPQVGNSYTWVSGMVEFAYGKYSLQPRNRSDIQLRAPVMNSHRSWGKIKSIYK